MKKIDFVIDGTWFLLKENQQCEEGFELSPTFMSSNYIIITVYTLPLPLAKILHPEAWPTLEFFEDSFFPQAACSMSEKS